MHFTMSTSDMPVGLLLIDTDTQPTGAEDSSDHSVREQHCLAYLVKVVGCPNAY